MTWYKGIDKKQEVISIFYGGIGIGFIARANVLYGWCDSAGEDWAAAPSLDGDWVRGFKDRVDAVEYLKDSNLQLKTRKSG